MKVEANLLTSFSGCGVQRSIVILMFFLENDSINPHQNFSQFLGENTCLSQPAVQTLHLSFKSPIISVTDILVVSVTKYFNDKE